MEQLSLRRRLPVVAVLVTVLLVVPLLAGGVAAGATGALAVGLGAVFTLLMVLKAGSRTALRVLPGLILVIALAARASGTWWWVALLVLLGVLAGLGSTRGRLVPAALAGMLAASTPPLGSSEDLLVRLSLAAVAGVYVVVVGRRLGLPDEVPAGLATLGSAPATAVALGAVVGVGATIALRWSDAHAYWIPLSIFLLAIPIPGVRIHSAARQRVLGTALGLAAPLPLVLVGVPGLLRLPLAVLLLLLVLAVPRPVWINAAFMTALLVLLLDAPTGRVTAGAMRLFDVTIAVALVLLGLVALSWWSGRHPPDATRQAVTEDVVESQR